MNSPYANLFLAIQDRILAEVPEIKFIDQNLGQYMHEKFRESMLFPCVLIDFPNTNFSEMQGNNQLGDVTIVATLFHDIWNNTSNITPLTIKQAGLQYLETDQKLFMALQGWNPDFCEPLIRLNSKSLNQNEHGLIVRETTFTTQFEDYSCDDASATVQLGLRTE
ncbi:hypothetical protein [Flavobacterium sp. UBA6046]|jgi:hypothetical protein|uniref:hypothetical protein n=1 Tax=Flavobacterium sp. UBA6046 TaxID=1946552 RepID=UPI0025BF798D|nr:hypothetical protein [Flavobacterium sp. UBA6046]